MAYRLPGGLCAVDRYKTAVPPSTRIWIGVLTTNTSTSPCSGPRSPYFPTAFPAATLATSIAPLPAFPLTVESMFAPHRPITMVSKIFLAASAAAAAAAVVTTTAASPGLPSTRVFAPWTVDLAWNLKNALGKMQSAARDPGLPCSLTYVDRVLTGEATQGPLKNVAIVRKQITLKYGKAVHTIEVRSSCHRSTAVTLATCGRLWSANWPAFCPRFRSSYLCEDKVLVRGLKAREFLGAMERVPRVCDGLPSFTPPPPEFPVEDPPMGAPGLPVPDPSETARVARG